ncbi:mobilization protein [Castellaniella hirudinis]|uniref:mobilization protein n=1 Tax=Castellaniella hirudinis TaxID=1144617 RepID=UPI0039C45EAF
MATIDDTIESLKERLKQAQARKQKAEALKRATDQKRTKKQDDKRKILVGAAILAKVERGEWPADKMREMMNTFLTRPAERALFDLPEKPDNQPTTP